MPDEYVTLRKPLYEEGAAPRAELPSAPARAREVPLFAGFWIRLFALAADILLVSVVHVALTALGFTEVFFALGPWTPLIGLIIFLTLFVAVPASVLPGQTLGKRILRLAVVTADGQNPPLAAYLKRFAIIFALFLVLWPQAGPIALREWMLRAPLLLGLGMVAVVAITLTQIVLFIIHPHRRGLHDLWAGTFVIRIDSANPVPAAVLQNIDDLTAGRVRRAERVGMLMPLALFVVLGAQAVLDRDTPAERAHEELRGRLSAAAGIPVTFFMAQPIPLDYPGAEAVAVASPEAAAAGPQGWQVVVAIPHSGREVWGEVASSESQRMIAEQVLDLAEREFDPAVYRGRESTPDNPIPDLPLALTVAFVYDDYTFVPGLPLLGAVAGGTRMAVWHRQYRPIMGGPVPGRALIAFSATPELTVRAATADVAAAPASP